MNSVINRTHEMFVRVLSFAAERAASFPAGSLGAQTVTVLKEVAETLTEAGTSQTSGLSSAQRATAERMTAREALRATLQSMNRTARVIAIDAPGLETEFRLPRSGSDPALLQAARAFAGAALPLKDEFIRHGMPPSFIEDLNEEIADLERAIGEQNTRRGAHVSATASVETEADRGMNAVRRLHVIVHNIFRDDPATLAAWESARHLASPSHTRRRSNAPAGDNDPGDDKKE